MGQAKLRGTKEDRIVQAQERQQAVREAEEAAAQERVRRLREQRAARMGLALSPVSTSGIVSKTPPNRANHRSLLRAALLTNAAMLIAGLRK